MMNGPPTIGGPFFVIRTGKEELQLAVRVPLIISGPRGLSCVPEPAKGRENPRNNGADDSVKPINLAEKLALFSTHWDPRVVADYNDNDVMVVKFKGEFPFHRHETSDDFFYVLEGQMIMDVEGREPQLVSAGELFVVPEGVVHRPRAEQEVKVLLIEPKGEPNSGDSGRPPAAKPRI